MGPPTAGGPEPRTTLASSAAGSATTDAPTAATTFPPAPHILIRAISRPPVTTARPLGTSNATAPSSKEGVTSTILNQASHQRIRPPGGEAAAEAMGDAALTPNPQHTPPTLSKTRYSRHSTRSGNDRRTSPSVSSRRTPA